MVSIRGIEFNHPAVYLRVSKEEMARDRDCLKRQSFAAQETVKELGFDQEQCQFFQDKQSGRRDDRRDFEKLLKSIRAGEIDLLIVYRIDRITRKLSTNAGLAEELRDLKIWVYVITKRRLLNIKDRGDWEEFVHEGVKAEGEILELAERVRLGLRFAKAQGKHVGGVPMGYVRVNGRLKPNQSSFQWKPEISTWDACLQMIEIIGNEYSQLAASKRIEEKLGVFIETKTLMRWLRNPVIQGYSKGPDGAWQKTHEGLITSEQLQQIELNLSGVRDRFNNRQKKQYDYLFTGFIYCATCGSRMEGMTYSKTLARSGKRKIYQYYRCRERRTGKKGSNQCVLISPYGTNGDREDRIEQAVIQALISEGERILNKAIRESEVEPISPETLRLQKQISQLKRMVLEMGDELGYLEMQIKALEGKLNRADDRENPGIDPGKAQWFGELIKDPDLWMEATREEKIVIYRWLIEEIRVGEKIEVKLKNN